MAALSLCSSPLTTTLPQISYPSISLMSQPNYLQNITSISQSLSSLKLTEKSSLPSFVLKSSALAEAEFESETTVLEGTKKPKGEEIYAVIEIGSRQYFVVPGRYLVTQRLKGAKVNDKVMINKMLLVGSKTKTWIGKPIVHNAVVHAVVEEQTLDEKKIVFKYKKKKNYRRNIGHRQKTSKLVAKWD